jgi:hypothetical protein
MQITQKIIPSKSPLGDLGVENINEEGSISDENTLLPREKLPHQTAVTN